MDKNYAQYLLKKGIQDYNLIAQEFSSKRQAPWPELKFLFDDYLVPGDRVLDLGCGNGRFYEFFRDKNTDYTGVDSSEELIKIAKEKYPDGRFLIADALQLPFPDNYFDKIYCIALFHHIPSKELRRRFLREARRVLKPGGLLILTVWKFVQPKMRLLLLKFAILKLLGLSRLDFGDILESWGRTEVKRYYHWFFRRELAVLFKDADFHSHQMKKIGICRNDRGNRQNIYVIAQK